VLVGRFLYKETISFRPHVQKSLYTTVLSEEIISLGSSPKKYLTCRLTGDNNPLEVDYGQ